ncbi:NAD(P)-dependent oxidoreductase [Devosia sp.]|uniref:NAD(P)-dependent oxidoreductase n=1 Tax=Devosia sp. TaxID=1871048 RepID=UPI002AFEB050|nr:DUF1932 domain-containing protein [Devosia sp.]
MRNETIAIIGFGEAGQAMARGWALPAGRVQAFDIAAANAGSPLPATAHELAVGLAATAQVALDRAGLVFVLVPTDQTLEAAEKSAPHLLPDTIWLDGSSSSPGRKREAGAIITKAGGRYVDMAIMAPVHPGLHRTPVLLSGEAAALVQPELARLDMVTELAGPDVGQASAIKMVRSVLVKGIEAVTAECFLAARRAGVEGAVLASLRRSDPTLDWQARAAYNLERMARHGHRRAAELREVVATLEELAVPGRMAAATALWQDQIGDIGGGENYPELAAQLDAVLAALE